VTQVIDLEPPASWFDGGVKYFLGTAQLGRAYGVISQDRPQGLSEEAGRVLQTAALLGFEAIDTAPVYGDAEVEIGKAKLSLPVYTKLDSRLSPADSLSRSLTQLQRASVDAIFLHEEFTLNPAQEGVLKELKSLQGEQAFKIGASIYSETEFHLANECDSIDVIQLPFNALDRRFSREFLSKHLRPGKEIIGRSVFLQGLLLIRGRTLPESVRHLKPWIIEIQAVAADFGLLPLQASLSFAAANDAISALVLGANNSAELREIWTSRPESNFSALVATLNSLDYPPWPAADPRTWKRVPKP